MKTFVCAATFHVALMLVFVEIMRDNCSQSDVIFSRKLTVTAITTAITFVFVFMLIPMQTVRSHIHNNFNSTWVQ